MLRWGGGHLLPTDRPAWSDRLGRCSAIGTPPSSFSLPSPEWRWAGPWAVALGTGVDAEGWAYNVDFPSSAITTAMGGGGADGGWSKKKSALQSVRRRRWVRTAVPPAAWRSPSAAARDVMTQREMVEDDDGGGGGSMGLSRIAADGARAGRGGGSTTTRVPTSISAPPSVSSPRPDDAPTASPYSSVVAHSLAFFGVAPGDEPQIALRLGPHGTWSLPLSLNRVVGRTRVITVRGPPPPPRLLYAPLPTTGGGNRGGASHHDGDMSTSVADDDDLSTHEGDADGDGEEADGGRGGGGAAPLFEFCVSAETGGGGAPWASPLASLVPVTLTLSPRTVFVNKLDADLSATALGGGGDGGGATRVGVFFLQVSQASPHAADTGLARPIARALASSRAAAVSGVFGAEFGYDVGPPLREALALYRERGGSSVVTGVAPPLPPANVLAPLILTVPPAEHVPFYWPEGGAAGAPTLVNFRVARVFSYRASPSLPYKSIVLPVRRFSWCCSCCTTHAQSRAVI